MGLQQVGKFKLNQDGAYVARTEFHYMGDDGVWRWSDQTNNELAGQQYTTDPGDLSVPDGSIVTFKLWVMAGYDREATQSFMYVKGNKNTAEYTSSNVTVDPHLTFNGVFTNA